LLSAPLWIYAIGATLMAVLLLAFAARRSEDLIFGVIAAAFPLGASVLFVLLARRVALLDCAHPKRGLLSLLATAVLARRPRSTRRSASNGTLLV
jgi:hypothetical protein